MNSPNRNPLVLAVYPNARGFAFALFEGPLSPVDWGVVEVRGKGKNRQCLERMAQMLGQHTPETLVLQNMDEYGLRRARRIRSLNEAIVILAETQGIPIFACSREQVNKCFAHLGLRTKWQIAEAIAKHIPVFERFVPPQRKPWMSEHSRMGLFDAVALILAFFQIGT